MTLSEALVGGVKLVQGGNHTVKVTGAPSVPRNTLLR